MGVSLFSSTDQNAALTSVVGGALLAVQLGPGAVRSVGRPQNLILMTMNELSIKYYYLASFNILFIQLVHLLHLKY